ncbi:MoaD/ThiS family protein [Candidatus Woesearchaeota archaeon]|nr:MoaD/ThiS family protein [Candidatus Woesearchaeota archaeon]
MVSVYLEREKETIEKEFSGKIKNLLSELNVNKETIVVVKNGEVVSEDERCEGKDELKLLSVVSGG